MKVDIGIIGLGTVGTGVYEVLKNNIGTIEERIGGAFNVKKICDKDESVLTDLDVNKEKFTSDYREIINDNSISLVVILTGNPDFAYRVIMDCFNSGKHVVTANKALMATKWRKIFNAARETKSLIYFEASVGSGIPVIQGINEGLAANRITSVKGILNGTTNFILTKMSSSGYSFKKAMAEAVEAGFAEPDSSADIEGLDAAHKTAVLANIIMPGPVNFKDIFYQGIENINLKDIQFAREMFDFRLKLLSVIKVSRNEVEVRIHPAFLQPDDMLAGVNYENNGILIEGDAAGPVMFYGKGAGSLPAASAVVSDIIYLAQKINYGIAGNIPYIHTDPERDTRVTNIGDLAFQYYVRFTTEDKPGVLSKISGILGNNDVSIASCFQKGRSRMEEVPIVMVTHTAKEKALNKALFTIDSLDVVKKKSVFIRIDSEEEIF